MTLELFEISKSKQFRSKLIILLAIDGDSIGTLNERNRFKILKL